MVETQDSGLGATVHRNDLGLTAELAELVGCHGELIKRDCRTPQKSLGRLTPEGLKQLDLLKGLHTFSDARQPQCGSQVHDAGNDREVVIVTSHPCDEGTIDLYLVDGQLLEVDEGRVPSAEVVQSDGNAAVAQLVQHH